MQSNTWQQSRKPARSAWILIAALFATAAQAQTATSASDRYLTGDWGGTRTELEDRGIDLGATYFTEGADNLKGGDHHNAAFAAELSVYGTLNLQKLWDWDGATFRFKFTHRNGDNLNDTASLHELMQSQPIYGRGDITRVSQFYLQQKLLQDKLTLKVGRLTVGDEFDDYPCDFMMLSLCGSQPGNMLGSIIYNNPISQWAGTLRYDFTPNFYASFGVYQVDTGYLKYSQGLNFLSPRGTIGMLIPAEIGWKWHPHGLTGSYKLGGWYDTAGGSDLYENTEGLPLTTAGGTARARGYDHGFYFSAVQQLTASESDPQRGLSVQFHTVRANPDITKVDRTVTLGFVYRGPFASRPDDKVGLAAAWLHVSNRLAWGEEAWNADLTADETPLAVQHTERTIELFYHLQVLPSISVSPALQYVHHPSGNSDYPDDLVFGLRSVFDF